MLKIFYFTIPMFILVSLASLTANIARKKGYSYAGFFFFGLFLFLPAIIVAACLPLKQGTLPQQAPSPDPESLTFPVKQYPPAQGQSVITVREEPPSRAAEPEDMIAGELARISQLRERGFITDEEYQAMRKKALGL